ncbi:MAG: DUF2660 domain-containing protein [Rickettsiaceae bacterium]|nr:DUF2660 domain-containing protein [Rickettsiaceae bacterium]
MPSTLSIIILAALAIGVFFIIRRFSSYKKPEHIVVHDPEAQAAYDKKHAEKNEEINLSLEERIELSWQFLTDITEKILNKFSKPDQDKVYQSGNLLAKNGAKYNHNVEQELSLTNKQVKTQVIEQNANKNKERSR